jgi:hypothetical protein
MAPHQNITGQDIYQLPQDDQENAHDARTGGRLDLLMPFFGGGLGLG